MGGAEWLKYEQNLFVKIVPTKVQNGWDDVLGAENGTPWWKKRSSQSLRL